MLEFFTLQNATYILMGASLIGTPLYLKFRKFLGYKPPQVFRTTQYKAKFKKHQNNFNKQFKRSKFFG